MLTPTDRTPVTLPRVRLKAATEATLTRPMTTTLVVDSGAERPFGEGSPSRAAMVASLMASIWGSSPAASGSAASAVRPSAARRGSLSFESASLIVAGCSVTSGAAGSATASTGWTSATATGSGSAAATAVGRASAGSAVSAWGATSWICASAAGSSARASTAGRSVAGSSVGRWPRLRRVRRGHGHVRRSRRHGLDRSGRDLDDRLRSDARGRRLADELVEGGGARGGAGLLERRRLRHLGRDRGELGGIVDLLEAHEEGVHLGFVLGDARLDVLDLALDQGGMALEAQLQLLLALGDALLGLGPDAGDLGLGPILDAGHVLVGHAAQAVDLLGRPGMDLLDRGRSLGPEAVDEAGAVLLGGRTHGAHEVGQEARRRSVGCLGRGGREGRGGRRHGRRGGRDGPGGPRVDLDRCHRLRLRLRGHLGGRVLRLGGLVGRSGGRRSISGRDGLRVGGHRLVLSDRHAHGPSLLLIRSCRSLLGRMVRLIGGRL